MTFTITKDPRIEEIWDVEQWHNDNIVDLKNNIKRFRNEFSDYEQAIIWYRIVRWREGFSEAMDALYNSSTSRGYVEIVGWYYTIDQFGHELIDERNYLDEFSNWRELQYVFLPGYQDYTQDDLEDLGLEIEDCIDYWKLGEELDHPLTHYDKIIDPKHPDKWMITYTE